MDFLEKLLECQRVESQINAVEDELRNSEVRKKLLHARNYIVNAQNNYKKMESDITELTAALEELSHRYEANRARAEQEGVHYTAADDESDLEDVQDMAREAQEINNALARNESDLQALIKRLATIDQEMKKMAANLPKARQDYNRLKAVYDKDLAAVTEKTDPLKKELAAIQADLPETLLARYAEARRHANNPLVPLDGNRCSGCHMELASAGLTKLKNQGLVECENCGRLIFIKE